MKTFKFTSKLLLLSLTVILLNMSAAEMQAQEIITSSLRDMIIPNDQDRLYIELKGGDGGKNEKAKGGRGATIKGTLNIGTASGMIAPGGTLRLITGKAGRSTNAKAGGGGGATGLIYRAPGSSEWEIIAVAAGGGGAFIDKQWAIFAWNKSGTDGGQGKANCSGIRAYPDHLGYMGGGATIGNGEGGCGGKAGMAGGVPRIAEVNSDCQWKGGNGFGGGGSGMASADNTDQAETWYGGGGGGYYGGYFSGNGSSTQYENGGGSYVDGAYSTYLKASTNGTTSSPEDGYVLYTYDFKPIKFAYNPNKCIDDTGSSTSNGTNIISYTCTSNPNQQWFIKTEDRTIHSLLNFNKCLDLSAGNTNNGANIQLWDCQIGNANQFWVYNGLYQTIHSGKNSDKCFDAANGSASTANVNLQLWDCQYTNANQKWTIDGATTVSDVSNKKHIIPAFHTGYAVHSHTGAESGSNIQLWTKDNTNTAEQWYFDGLAIKMRNNQNLCIDLNQSNTSNGNNIQLYNCNGSNAQKWLYDGMTQSIRSVVNPDKCMQIEKNTDGAYGKRSNVNIYDCNGSQEQQFLIQE